MEILNQFSLKKNAFAYFGLFVGLLVIATQSSSVQARLERNADVVHSEMRSITVEGWDKDYSGQGYGWRVSTNRDTKDKAAVKAPYKSFDENLLSEREVKLVPGSPVEIRENIGWPDNYILGVRFTFTFPGDNLVSIYPPDADQYTVERIRYHLSEAVALGTSPPANKACFRNPSLSTSRSSNRTQVLECLSGVNLPGKIHKISVWVLGRGNKYDLEAWLEDWRGGMHRVKMGSINHIGWQPLSGKVNRDVPQESLSIPQTKTLVLKKLVLRPSDTRGKSNANEESVYVFFDELRVLASDLQQNYDGAQIDFDRIDCERKNQLYRSLRNGSRAPDQWPRIADCTKAPGPARPLPITQSPIGK